MQLFDTLTAEKKELVPEEPGHLRLYVCGPTVDGHAHIGHARCYIIYDVLVRHLRDQGLRVTYVRNVTDIDDKIIKRCEGTEENPKERAERIFKLFSEDLEKLGNLKPDIEPKVSEHLDEIKSLIAELIEKGAAYESEGDVYFSVPGFKNYGKLSGRNLEELSTGASGRTDETEASRKRNDSDFALWKKAKDCEPSWESPWGAGRPGWHIECSAMSMKHLGPTFDLHGGGLDLVFPHHENEIAQSEGATGKQFVKHWMHNGFVQMNKEKMSKSVGNVFSVLESFKFAEPEAVRTAMFNVHYRSPLNMDWTTDAGGNTTGFPLFEEAERRLEYLYETIERVSSLPKKRIGGDGPSPKTLSNFPELMNVALNDDLNMPVALAHSIEFLRAVNEACDGAMAKGGKISSETVDAIKTGFTKIATVLGIGAQNPQDFLLRVRERRAKALGLSAEMIEKTIKARTEARKRKDFAASDQLRDELAAQGVKLLDSPDGTTWKLETRTDI